MTKNSQTARTSEAPEMLFLAELPDQSDYIWLLSFEDTRVALFHNNQAPRTTKEIKPFLLAFPTRLLAFFHQVAKVRKCLDGYGRPAVRISVKSSSGFFLRTG